jgi:hypothetical protein
MKENVLRGFGPTAIHARATHCPHGHPFDSENTQFRKKGGRSCAECHRLEERKRWRLGLGH